MAHNVHATPSEIDRLAAAGTAVAHCPGSNAALGSGCFPLRRHVDAGVTCALGTDVGGGVGIRDAEGRASGVSDAAAGAGSRDRSMPRGCCTWQRAPARRPSGSTRRSATFTPGKAADFVYLQPPADSVLDAVVRRADDPGAGARCAVHAGAAPRAFAKSESKADVVFSNCRIGRTMTLAELNAKDRTRLRRCDRLGLRGLAVGGRACMGHAAVRDARRACTTRWRRSLPPPPLEEQLALSARASGSRRGRGLTDYCRRPDPFATHRSASRPAPGLDALTPRRARSASRAERRVSGEVRVSVSVCREGQHEARYSQRARAAADVDARRRTSGSAAAGVSHRPIPIGREMDSPVRRFLEHICLGTKTPLLRQGRCHRVSAQPRRQGASRAEPGVRRQRAAACSMATHSGKPTRKATTAASSRPTR